MNPQLILQPLVAMFLLTMLVWIVMYVRRISFMAQHKIKAQEIATPELLNAKLPASVNNASNNLKNLFELPLIFYVLCLCLLFTHATDRVFLVSAWLYVGFRAVHSLIHCGNNAVNARFASYLLSCFVLGFMVLRLALQIF